MTNHIFIIDDDPELTGLLQEFLESHNYHITIFLIYWNAHLKTTGISIKFLSYPSLIQLIKD